MKIKRLIIYVACPILLLVMVFISAACAKPSAPPQPSPTPTPSPAPTPAPAQPIEIKAVGFQPITATVMEPFAQYIDTVNTKSNGAIKIEFIGARDVIPQFDQPQAVANNVVGMSALPASYASALVPAGFGACILSENTPMDEFNNGWYDFMVDIYGQKGIRFLTRTETNQTFHIGTKKEVSSPTGLKGQKIRTGVLYDAFLEALGCVPVSIPHPEVYTSLERGVVDGYAFPFSDVADLSLFEVVPYFIDHTMYESGNLIAIMNLETWESMPQDLQDLMYQTAVDMAPVIWENFGKNQAAARQKMIDEGMTPITFSAAEAKAYRDLAFSSLRDQQKELVEPATWERLTEVISK